LAAGESVNLIVQATTQQLVQAVGHFLLVIWVN
jgi:hypothetical protein